MRLLVRLLGLARPGGGAFGAPDERPGGLERRRIVPGGFRHAARGRGGGGEVAALALARRDPAEKAGSEAGGGGAAVEQRRVGGGGFRVLSRGAERLGASEPDFGREPPFGIRVERRVERPFRFGGLSGVGEQDAAPVERVGAAGPAAVGALREGGKAGKRLVLPPEPQKLHRGLEQGFDGAGGVRVVADARLPVGERLGAASRGGKRGRRREPGLRCELGAGVPRKQFVEGRGGVRERAPGAERFAEAVQDVVVGFAAGKFRREAAERFDRRVARGGGVRYRRARGVREARGGFGAEPERVGAHLVVVEDRSGGFEGAREFAALEEREGLLVPGARGEGGVRAAGLRRAREPFRGFRVAREAEQRLGPDVPRLGFGSRLRRRIGGEGGVGAFERFAKALRPAQDPRRGQAGFGNAPVVRIARKKIGEGVRRRGVVSGRLFREREQVERLRAEAGRSRGLGERPEEGAGAPETGGGGRSAVRSGGGAEAREGKAGVRRHLRSGKLREERLQPRFGLGAATERFKGGGVIVEREFADFRGKAVFAEQFREKLVRRLVAAEIGENGRALEERLFPEFRSGRLRGATVGAERALAIAAEAERFGTPREPRRGCPGSPARSGRTPPRPACRGLAKIALRRTRGGLLRRGRRRRSARGPAPRRARRPRPRRRGRRSDGPRGGGVRSGGRSRCGRAEGRVRQEAGAAGSRTFVVRYSTPTSARERASAGSSTVQAQTGRPAARKAETVSRSSLP